MAMDPMVVANASAILGEETARESIVAWLGQVTESPEQQGPVDLMLQHIAIDGDEQIVGRVTHSLEQSHAVTAAELVKRAAAHIGRDPQAYRETYSVVVEGREEVRQNFELEQTPSAGGYPAMVRRPQPGAYAEPSFSPDLAGLMGQNMEINLQLTQNMAVLATNNLRDKDRTIATQAERIRLLEKNEWAYRREIERLLDRSVERKMMLEDQQADIKRKDTYAEMFKSVLPHFAGWALGPQAVQIAAMIQAMNPANAKKDDAGDEDEDPNDEREDSEEETEEPSPSPRERALAAEREVAQAAFHHIDTVFTFLDEHQPVLHGIMAAFAEGGETKEAAECVRSLMALHEIAKGLRARRVKKTNGAGRSGFRQNVHMNGNGRPRPRDAASPNPERR